MSRTEAGAHRGRFITIEGSEGAGKSSCLQVVLETLAARGITVHQTREPGGTPFAEELRECLLRPRTETVAPMAELLLVFAARAQHVAATIEPQLAEGTWVVCDRFTDASYAYQGFGRGLPLDAIAALEAWTHPGLQPDLTLLMDLDPDIGSARIRNRDLDRMEQEQRTFFNAVREGYRQRAAEFARFRVIDASAPIESVHGVVRGLVADYVDAAAP